MGKTEFAIGPVKRGRPTLFTPENREKILKAIRAGNYNGVAAKSAGVSHRVFNQWVARGKKEKEGEFYQFFLDVTEAENVAEIEAVYFIREAGKGDPKHYQWWLERKFPERWGRDTYQIKQVQAELEELKRELRLLGVKRNTPVAEEVASSEPSVI